MRLGKRMRLFSRIALAVAVVVGFLSTTEPAHAVATLRVSGNGGVNWIKLRDTDGNGEVSYDGSVNGGWTLSLAAGTTKPAIGSATDPIMNLSAANISSTGAGTLLIEYSETFYGPLPDGNSFITSLNSENVGTGRTTVWSYLSTANTLFDKAELLGAIVQTGPNGNSSVQTGGMFGYSEFSLTMRISIRHTGAGDSSFTARLVDPPPSVPDGGSTVVLLGFALLAVGGSLAWINRSQKA